MADGARSRTKPPAQGDRDARDEAVEDGSFEFDVRSRLVDLKALSALSDAWAIFAEETYKAPPVEDAVMESTATEIVRAVGVIARRLSRPWLDEELEA